MGQNTKNEKAPDILERKTTRKTTSSSKKSITEKKTEIDAAETVRSNAKAASRAAFTGKKPGRPAGKAEPVLQKPIPSEHVEPNPEFIALKQLMIPFYERYLLTVEETGAYFHIGFKKMYEMVRENTDAPWLLFNGNRKMIKREMFARWIDRQSEI